MTYARIALLIGLLAGPAWCLAEVTGTTRVGNLPGAGNGASAVFATAAPGRPDELFVLDQRGLIQVLNLETGIFNSTPFLDIQGLVDDAGNEQGLLGLAFDPGYTTNGYFYVNYTRDPGPGRDRTRIERYQVANPLTDSATSIGSGRSVLEFDQDFSNHNGGWIGFSPVNGLLYINTGDGGSGNDPNNRAQQLNTRLGKILRVDPSGDDFPSDATENYTVPGNNPLVGDNNANTLDEIFAYGLRNPWRASFDRETGDLWIGDVGQGAREEIDLLRADRDEIANFGWRLREGDIQTPSGGVGGPIPPNYVGPEYDYLSNGSGLFGGNSTVGGYVYRGPDPEVQGRYFFGDSFPSQLWSFNPADPDGTVQNLDSLLNPFGAIGTPTSFAEDAYGNLYILDREGDIHRIVTDALRAGDFNGDGEVDGDDYALWREEYGVSSPSGADGNADGVVNAADYTIWRDAVAAQDASAVPEPSSGAVVLLALAASAISSSRRRPPLA
ncbi:Soluble aldose sugar dehydrogenase YliI precursor [Planctomycetes bacterium MalM25]|nr:Soluble aldose sugar dehydrogenase YliI precursor [Planctomycetes bacterium MalM25]